MKAWKKEYESKVATMTLQELRKERRELLKLQKEWVEIEDALSEQCWSVSDEDDEPSEDYALAWPREKIVLRHIHARFGKKF